MNNTNSAVSNSQQLVGRLEQGRKEQSRLEARTEGPGAQEDPLGQQRSQHKIQQQSGKSFVFKNKQTTTSFRLDPDDKTSNLSLLDVKNTPIKSSKRGGLKAGGKTGERQEPV